MLDLTNYKVNIFLSPKRNFFCTKIGLFAGGGFETICAAAE